jgi:hypothetical protein
MQNVMFVFLAASHFPHFAINYTLKIQGKTRLGMYQLLSGLSCECRLAISGTSVMSWVVGKASHVGRLRFIPQLDFILGFKLAVRGGNCNNPLHVHKKLFGATH